jgi:hypothetical protein
MENKMWNTDGGSMMGSGIYSDSCVVSGLACEGVTSDEQGNETDCTFEGEVDVYFDDWGRRGVWTCGVCKSDNEYEFPAYEDSDPDYGDEG